MDKLTKRVVAVARDNICKAGHVVNKRSWYAPVCISRLCAVSLFFYGEGSADAVLVLRVIMYMHFVVSR